MSRLLIKKTRICTKNDIIDLIFLPMKKWIWCILIGLIIGIIGGFLIGVFSIGVFNINIDVGKSYGILEVVYYIVAPIGIVATLLAVVVALFGNEFKNFIFREKSSSTTPNHFTEVLRNEDDDTPEAIRYECNLEVKNDCGREISECAVYLIDVEYCDIGSTTPKKFHLQNRQPIYWNGPDVKVKNITQGETATITLLRINPEISQSKPDNTDVVNIPRKLSIVGYRLNEKYLKKGQWKLTYCVCNNHRELERFEIHIHWSGVWKSREKEMNNEATINFVKK